MRIRMESTTRISEVVNEGRIRCRVWEGVTDHGVKVCLLVAAIAVAAEQDGAQFAAELRELKPPTDAAADAFPLRLIL